MPINGYATDDDVSSAFGNPLLALSSPNMQSVYEQARRGAMQNQMAGAQSIEDQFFGGKKPESSILEKLFGLGGVPRTQTWPERIMRYGSPALKTPIAEEIKDDEEEWQPHEWMPGAFTHQGHVLVPVGDDHASR